MYIQTRLDSFQSVKTPYITLLFSLPLNFDIFVLTSFYLSTLLLLLIRPFFLYDVGVTLASLNNIFMQNEFQSKFTIKLI